MFPWLSPIRHTCHLLHILISSVVISKPGKDPTNPTDYRSVALPICIYKTMEGMIIRRLVWYFEPYNLLTKMLGLGFFISGKLRGSMAL